MTSKPITFGSKEWHAYIKQKYAGKSISPQVAHNARLKLEKKYGEKIILGKFEDMLTDEEKTDFAEYKALGDELYRISPEYKNAEDMLKRGHKLIKNANETPWILYRMFIGEGKKIFLVILGVLLLLALIKYLLT